MTPAKSLFSVVVPTFNRADTIERTISTILNQTWTDFELLVVDDGSIDHTRQIVDSVNDARLRYVYQTNMGRSAARNKGATLAKGTFLTFLDSDDEARPTWLATFASAIQTTDNTGVVCCGVEILLEMGDQPGQIVLPTNLGLSYADQSGLFWAGTFAVRRDVFDQVGGYAAQLDQGENTELGRRLTFYCAEHGLATKIAPSAEIAVHRRKDEFSPTDLKRFESYLKSATFMLEQHGDKLLADPHRYALSCGIAGVNAARLGRTRDARSYFVRAIRVDPLHWKHYARLMMLFVPNLAERFWLRER